MVVPSTVLYTSGPKMATLSLLVLVLLVVAIMSASIADAQTSLTEADKQLLLNLHNRERSQANPSAANMEMMVWNDELAGVAQRYAEGCVYEHNSDRSVQAPSFTYVGENIAAGTGGNSYQSLFDLWANEKNDYSFDNNVCSGVCGHYTQIVWATSNNVGCGAYRCASLQETSFNNALYLVCNYGPGGNINGRRPYTRGTPCTECSGTCVENQCSTQTANTTGATTSGAQAQIISTVSVLMLIALTLLTLAGLL